MPALLLAFVFSFATIPPLESWVASEIVIRGTVTSEFGAPIQGANVFSTEHATSVGTGADGAYLMKFRVPDDTKSLVLRVRSVGFTPQVRIVAIVGDTITEHFTMRQDVNRLEEIAVAGVAELSTVRGLSGKTPGTRIAASGMPFRVARDPHNTEEYARIEDNRFLSVASAPLSTFSVDVDRASYTNVRRFINSGTLPPKDAVRIEELLNYFAYEYAAPGERHPISITTDVTPAPWKPEHRIVRIGLQTKPIPTAKLPPNNLVFLIDVSGSMMPPNKLPLVKQAFRLLVNELREEDRVAIVVYAGRAGLVLPSTSAAEKQVILDAIERLESGGSTAGGAGIRLAYAVARDNRIARGNNRVILATDGDFNVGVSSTSELVRYVEEQRGEGGGGRGGIALTVLGFGMGNYKDGRLEQLADKGNGNYAYIDDLLEAKKMFVQEMGATLLTVAKDVKLQVEFNPAVVQAYRLIGYENRLLANEDFTDDRKDAGDIGAGHSVTALYEIVPVGVKSDVVVGTTEPLRYQRPPREGPAARSGELLFVNVRYKAPADSTSRLMQHAVADSRRAPTADLRFALAVAGYGMLLRDSEFKGSLTYDDVLTLARDGAGDDRLRQDFVSLVERTSRIASGVATRER